MNKFKFWLAELVSPKLFFNKTNRLSRILPFITLLTLACGAWWGLFWAPADYQQKDAFRIIYIHVPAAFMSMGVYTAMSFAAISSFIWRVKLADLFIKAAAPIGASLALLALITGSIWGKPMWGTWWIWDARLTTELILFFIYCANMILRAAIQHNPEQAQKAVALFTLIGFVDIPLIHFSVEWWQTLHQGPTLSRFAKPTMDPSMLWPLLIMIVGFALMVLVNILWRLRADILLTEKDKRWVKEVLC